MLTILAVLPPAPVTLPVAHARELTASGVPGLGPHVPHLVDQDESQEPGSSSATVGMEDDPVGQWFGPPETARVLHVPSTVSGETGQSGRAQERGTVKLLID